LSVSIDPACPLLGILTVPLPFPVFPPFAYTTAELFASVNWGQQLRPALQPNQIGSYTGTVFFGFRPAEAFPSAAARQKIFGSGLAAIFLQEVVP
jgi:hypothetical protein